MDRSPDELSGAAATQYGILDEMDVPTSTDAERLCQSDGHSAIVDALIGYVLDGEVRPPASRIIDILNQQGDAIVSLDVASGIDATTGETPGGTVTPDRPVTLALPKLDSKKPQGCSASRISASP